MVKAISVPQIDEEPVASVMRILQLEELPGDSFRAASLPQVRRVYGGQVLAQGLLAAGATIDDDKRLPHSLHAYFLRGGDPFAPFDLQVTRMLDGRSFSNRHVAAFQDGRELLSLNASFETPSKGVGFDVTAPNVIDPDSVKSALEIFRTTDHPVAKYLGKTAAFDMRHVQGSLYTGADPERRPYQQLWMRPRTTLPDGMRQLVHRALLAYAIDQVMLEPCLRATGLSWLTDGMSLASLDHAMWFHADVDINEWLLVDGRADAVGGARAKSHIRVFNQAGRLVASASQEGMVRVPEDGQQVSAHWGFQ